MSYLFIVILKSSAVLDWFSRTEIYSAPFSFHDFFLFSKKGKSALSQNTRDKSLFFTYTASMFVFVCLFPQVHWSHQLTFNPSKQLSSQNIQNFTLSIDQVMRGAQCLLSKFELVYPNVLEWGPRCSEADGRLKQNSGEVGGGKGDRYRAPYNFRPSAALWGQRKLQRGHLQRTVGKLRGINTHCKER